MSVDIIRGNALALPLADNSVDLVVTSPPYFGLRSYTDGGEHYDGQIGSEATPTEFLDALIAATAEMVRVVKSSGSIWVNLGDKYNAHPTGHAPNTALESSNNRTATYQPGMGQRPWGGRPKSLLGIPWRYAIRCIDDLGLILRAEVIWAKPNGLPESVTDRVRRSHEQWFHFTLQPRYFSAVDEIREAHTGGTHPSGMNAAVTKWESGQGVKHRTGRSDPELFNPLGKLPGSVWTIPTQPLTVPPELGIDHFAAFPMEWPRRIIRGWSPSGICVECGEGRRPVADVDLGRKERQTPRYDSTNHARHGGSGSTLGSRGTSATILGYACACPEPTAATTPATVLDPFGGTGTTALVAHALGRRGISVDMSADYCRLATWRTSDRGQLAAAMQVDKPAPVPDDQLDIFGGDAA